MIIRDMDLNEYEVIMRFPAPPPSFEHEDTPDEVALVRIPNTADGVMICGRLESKPWHNPKRWIVNYGDRAAVRYLLAEIERLKAENATLRKLAPSPYGYCPTCGAPGKTRERRLNGNDKCVNGHIYPSKKAVHP